MYKFKREKQISFTDFNQPLGLQMNPDNRWVKKAAMIPWETIEAVPEPYRYACKAPAHGTRFAADSEAISLILMRNWSNRSEKTRTISISSVCPDMKTRFRLCRLCLLNFASVCLKRC